MHVNMEPGLAGRRSPGRSAGPNGGAGDSCGVGGWPEALDGEKAAGLAAMLHALADPVRLQMVAIIARSGEVCSCELEAPLGRSQSTISHHTKVLADAGVLAGERRGRWMWWKTVPDAATHLRAALAEVLGDPGGAEREPR